MDEIETKIEMLENEVKEMLCCTSTNEPYCWASFYTCAQMVKIFGVENMPKLTLPPNCVCKHEFLRQKQEIYTLIDRLTLSLESGISQYVSLKSQRDVLVWSSAQIADNKKKIMEIEGKVKCYEMELGYEYQKFYKLMKLNPIDSEKFYNELTPKLGELMELFNKRLELKIQSVT
jgi:hypothetical protein